jgi:hypothetical protein
MNQIKDNDQDLNVWEKEWMILIELGKTIKPQEIIKSSLN